MGVRHSTSKEWEPTKEEEEEEEEEETTKSGGGILTFSAETDAVVHLGTTTPTITSDKTEFTLEFSFSLPPTSGGEKAITLVSNGEYGVSHDMKEGGLVVYRCGRREEVAGGAGGAGGAEGAGGTGGAGGAGTIE